MCCSASNRTAMRFRIAASRKVDISSGVRYFEHSWNLWAMLCELVIAKSNNTYPFAMTGMSLAWACTSASNCAVNLALSSRSVTGGYVASNLKLLL